MRRIVLALLIGSLLSVFGVQAQFIPKGMSYQAVARDASGLPMANSTISLKISLGSETKGTKTYFSEVHEVKTDDLGQFNLVIGDGKRTLGALSAIPWAQEQIWLDIEMAKDAQSGFSPVSRSRLWSVPYAKHAATASKVVSNAPEDKGVEKNQSIYWLTGGNSLTSPPTQFLGTRDAQDLEIKTHDTTRVTVTKAGQFRIDSGVNGPSDDLGSYPLTVEGSFQGIYIKVNGSRNKSNNYLNFGDDEQFSWGRVEGQTFSDLEGTWQYQLQVSQYVLAGAALALRIAAFIAKQVGDASGVCCQPELPGTITGTIGLIVEAAGLLANSITWGIKIREEIGVVYATGAGDYAEWLKRQEGERDLFFGEVVGVKAGMVSLNTQDADHFLVVSMAPAVLANTPQPAQKADFEKIAFLGQVPVKVAGQVAIGDYILPSGNNDGLAIAVHPQDMKSGDYARVIGVAWETAVGEGLFNYVKTAIGINTNDMSKKVDLLNRRVENIVAYLEGKAPLLEDSALVALPQTPAQANPFTKVSKIYTDEEIDQILDRGEPFLKSLYSRMEEELRKQGLAPENNPQIKTFLDNPIPVLKEMRRNPAFYTQWALLDQELPSKKK